MSKGKFEATKARPSARQRKAKKPNIALPIIIGVAAVAVLVAGIWLIKNKAEEQALPEVIPDKVSICGVDLSGMTEEEAVAAINAASTEQFSQDMTVNMGEDAAPVVIPAAEIKIGIDAEKAAKAARSATFDEDGTCVLKTESFLKMDEGYLKKTANQAVTEYSREMQQSKIEEKTQGEGEEKTRILLITTGIDQHSFTTDDFCTCVRDGYVALNFNPELHYTEDEKADPVDADKLAEQYCIEPKDAAYDPNSEDYVTPDEPGFGFDVEALRTQLAEAKPGDQITVELTPIEAELTAEKLKASLFKDVLGACDTAHTWINDRTHNLELACKAINGTVVLPGKVFSFNETVGERTKDKGYREATAYVGGQSVPEVGGGVCQVASTIYSACLYADLEIVYSTCHNFFVTYVNPGMDAAIYWPDLDYKFRNNTEYPLRIDASVHDGRVWISLVGTNTRDYTVKMTWELLSTTPWETVEHEIKPGEPYRPGEEITGPYTGYKYKTYMSKYDLNGNLISTEEVRVSNYSKRDRVIAVTPAPQPTEPKPTDPPAPTEPEPTQPTQPPTQPTQPPTEPEPTEPEPTEPPAPPEEGDGG